MSPPIARLLPIVASIAWVVVGVATGVTAQSAASLGPVVEPSAIEVGERVHVMVQVRDVTDLNAADIRVAFDPTVLHVVDADPTKEGVQIELLDAFLKPDFVLGNAVDNTLGTVWVAATQLNPSVPASGSGNLARITIEGRMAGTSGITIDARKLVRPSGDPIPVDVFAASVTVGAGGPSRTPPPTVTGTPSATPSPPGANTQEPTPITSSTALGTPTTSTRFEVYCPFTIRYRR